ncbi:hypothetical protein D1007_53075 [Hordeum vulgare]|nr:hypothetical protein D1007_53075 [Hordeum vulgare]
MSPSASEKAKFRGAWEGSDVTEGVIEVLRHRRMLPSKELVMVRLPDTEASPTPRAGEPHHLVPNAVVQLAAFVTLCKGFVGIEPQIDLWRQLFFFKQQSTPNDVISIMRMTPCGAALVHHRTTSWFPKSPLQDSVKKWQRGFFYVKNVDLVLNYINLPPFAIDPSTVKLNWKSTLPKPISEVKQICAHLEILKARGLQAADLLATMVARRILPVQHRPHLICQMGDRYDPCRLSTKNLRASRVAYHVNLISSASMDEGGEWEWGMPPYNRSHPAPMPPAGDMEASDPAEIEDDDEVELQPSASEDTEEVLESEGTETAGEFFASGLLDWTDDDKASPPLHHVANMEVLEELEEVSSLPLTWQHRAAHVSVEDGEGAWRKGK